MRTKIPPGFIDALKKAIEESGSQSELGRRSGVGQATISAIINPKKRPRMILQSILDKLYPFCNKYLPADLQKPDSIAPEMKVNSSHSVDSIIRYSLEVLTDPDLSPVKKVRLLTLYFKEKI